MTPEFLAAVIDTLLPGDAALPSGTRAGLHPTAYANAYRAVFDVIAAQAGSVERFVQADVSARTAALAAVERAQPDTFRALLIAVLSDYYESAPVLGAIGWRVEPPQPAGHAMPALDGATREALERMARRQRLWR